MTFVVTDGQMAQLDRAPSALPVLTVRIADDFTQDYGQIWRSNQQVRTVISFLARNIAQLGLHTFRRVSDTDRVRVTDHPLPKLLGKPNPRTTRYRMIDGLVHDLGIYDNAIWLKSRVGDLAQSLIRLPPARVTPIGESWLWPEKYRFTGSRGYRDLDPDQVVHFRGYNPDDARWGVSPMETLRRILAEEYQSGLAREQLNRNGARFSGWISRPATAPAWSAPAAAQFAADFHSAWSGDGPRAGGTPVLEDGMEYKAEGVSPKDLQYIEVRKLTREEIASAFHIPPPLIGILDHATFSNITQQHQQLYQDTLGPWLQMIAEEIALQLIPDFDLTGQLYVEFNIAEKLKGSEEQFQQIQTAVGGPWMTRNEARARQNLSSIDGGDELITPMNVTVGGQASPTDSAPPPKALTRGVKARAGQASAASVEATLVRYFKRQRDVVLTALGSKAAGDWWDGERWDRELTKDLTTVAVKVSAQVAEGVLVDLGFSPDDYDVDRTRNFLKAVAASRAKWINAATKQQIDDALDADDTAVDAVFDTAETSRAAGAAVTLVTTLSAFGTTEAAKQVGGDTASKTWRTRSSNPRSAHAAMDGETVPVGEKFSNGAEYPGDATLGVDGVAGCQCDIEVNV